MKEGKIHAGLRVGLRGELLLGSLTRLESPPESQPLHDGYGKTKITADIAGLAEKLSKGVVKAEELLGKTLGGLPSDSAAVVLRAYDEANNPQTYPLLHPTGEIADPNGGTYSWLTFKNIRNCIEIIRGDGSVEHISSLMGGAHKIRNFYNNLIAPDSEWGSITVDTHAVAAGLLMPLGGSSDEVGSALNTGGKGSRFKLISSGKLGLSGSYAIFADAYREAAKRISERDGTDLLPRELQSITWEAGRGLFSSAAKRNKQFSNEIRQIWSDISKGRISYENARQEIFTLAGGIEAPRWLERNTGGNDPGQPTANPGDLLQTGYRARIRSREAAAAGARSGRAGVPSARRVAPSRSNPDLSNTNELYGNQNTTGPAGQELSGGPQGEARGSNDGGDIASRGARFLAGITRAYNEHPNGAAVEVKPLEFYLNPENTLFMADDGSAGVVVTKDGDWVSGFRIPGSKADMSALLEESAKITKTGDAFDTGNGVLPTLYSKYGFRVVARLPFNDKYAPPGWDYDKMGRPDVVFMAKSAGGRSFSLGGMPGFIAFYV